MGVFDAEVSTPTRKVTGKGTAGWIVGGLYDDVTETISIAIRSSNVDAKGKETPLEGPVQSEGSSFSTTLNWGWKAPTDYLGNVDWTKDPSTILDALRAPSPLPIASGRESDICMIRSLPQTGLREFQLLRVDLKEAKPQTFTQTFQDETGFGERTTTWEFSLIPHFNIERDDSPQDGYHSFVSTDFIRLRMDIPGVTVAESGWSNLPSWEVKGTLPFSGRGNPSQIMHSTAFSFHPNPAELPTGGSTSHNRPIQYTVSAKYLNGYVQFFILTQDEKDILRQEYIDHRIGVVPSRDDCVAHRIDNSFNEGNYNIVLDGGMQNAFDKVASEFGKDYGGVRVVGGFRSPQRNKAIGDIIPNKHMLGRALDLALQLSQVRKGPESDTSALSSANSPPILMDRAQAENPSTDSSLIALYQTCVRLGYKALYEAAPGKAVPPGSPDAKHVHIDW